MLVHEFLEATASRLPTKTALICNDERLEYAELEERSNRLANALISCGVTRGDRVAIFLPNCVEAVVGVFAVLKAGGVFVVINYSTKHHKLGEILNDCQARALITARRSGPMIRQVQRRVQCLQTVVITSSRDDVTPPFVSYEAVQRDYAPSRPRHVNVDLDLACLMYTSGSTGKPKGVMCDHSNVVFAVRSITSYLENTSADVIVNLLPLSFDYGLYQVLMTASFGGTLVLERGFTYPASVLRRIEQEKVTGLPGVPTVFARLFQMDLSGHDLRSLRYITNTAAALPGSHVVRLRRMFPQAKIYSMYGLTETKRTLYLPPEEIDRRPDSVGIAIPGTEVWIEDDQGNRLGPGQVGELVVRGRHVMRGYWGDETASALRYRPGTGAMYGERVCYSGDLFRTDADGFYHFVGRKDDIIKSRGEKVAPTEVERTICELEGVVEAAVVGVPDAVLGQAVRAFVAVTGRELSELQVLAHCRARLEDHMVPRGVEFRKELPKTSSGKIAKNLLM